MISPYDFFALFFAPLFSLPLEGGIVSTSVLK